MATVKLLLSSSPVDGAFCWAFVLELLTADTAIWFDGLSTSPIKARHTAIRDHPITIFALSPAAMAAPLVQEDMKEAVRWYHREPGRLIICLLSSSLTKVDLSGFLPSMTNVLLLKVDDWTPNQARNTARQVLDNLALPPRGVPPWVSSLTTLAETESIEVLLVYAMSLAWQGWYDDALHLLVTITTHDPTWSEGWVQRGSVLLTLLRNAPALAALDQALMLTPSDERAWLSRGRAFAGLRRYAEAAVAFAHICTHDSSFAEAWYEWGHALVSDMQYAEALHVLDHTLALAPQMAQAWQDLGAVHSGLSAYPESLAAYEYALMIDNSLVWSWDGKGDALYELGRYDDALAAFDQAIALYPKYAWFWNSRGKALEALERFTDAITAYQQALVLEPQLAWAWFNLGEVLTTVERYKEAMEAYDKAIVCDPEMVWAYTNQCLAQDAFEQQQQAELTIPPHDQQTEDTVNS